MTETVLPTRRDVVQAGALTLGTAAFAVSARGAPPASRSAPPQTLHDTPASGTTARGCVFDDRGGAGRRTEQSVGLAGVLVSNGRDVVLTDTSGRFALPVASGDVVFVIKPTGYGVPIDAQTMLPRFYYIHQPEGSPANLDLRYRGLAPTGPLPASIDFALTRQDEPEIFDVVLFTDPQPESEMEVGFIRDAVVEGLVGTNAAFGITAGDVMFDDLSMYPRYLRILAQIGLPWYNIGGNHDLNFEAPDRRYSRETFKRVFGPPVYAFQYGGALFLMLDNVEYLGSDATKPRGAGQYRGHFGDEQLAFVTNVLAQTPKDRLVVLVMHIPLRTYSNPGQPNDNAIDAPAFLRLLEGRPSVSFAGHTHTTEHHYLGVGPHAAAVDGLVEAHDGGAGHHHHVLTAVSGSWWSGPIDRHGIATADSRDGTPNGYHVLSIDHGRYTTRFQAAREAAGKQMRIMLDWAHHGDKKELLSEFPVGRLLASPIARDNVYATDVLVNVFDGGPRTRVRCTIGSGFPFDMERVRRPDPFVEEVYARNDATKKPWVKAEPSSHLWRARLPRDLVAGTHVVRVVATDEYGRPHHDSLILEIVDP